MGTCLFKQVKVCNIEVRVKMYSCGCKQVKRGKSYSSVRTQQPESECTQWTLQAYKRKEGIRNNLY